MCFGCGVSWEEQKSCLPVQIHIFAPQKTLVEVLLNPGEAIFIPIGWWYCIEDLDVFISISVTGYNVKNDFFKRLPE